MILTALKIKYFLPMLKKRASVIIYKTYKKRGVLIMTPVRKRRVQGKKIAGLVMLSMGIGMLSVILLPGWGFLFAAFLVVFGFWNLFMC